MAANTAAVDTDQLSFVTDSDDMAPMQPGAGRTLDNFLTVGGRWLDRRLAKLPGLRPGLQPLNASSSSGACQGNANRPSHAHHPHSSFNKARPSDFDHLSVIEDDDTATIDDNPGAGRTLMQAVSQLAPYVEKLFARWDARIGRDPFILISRLLDASSNNIPVDHNEYTPNDLQTEIWPFTSVGRAGSIDDLVHFLLDQRPAFFFSRTSSEAHDKSMRVLVQRNRTRKLCKKLIQMVGSSNPTASMLSIYVITLLVAFHEEFRTIFDNLRAVEALEKVLSKHAFHDYMPVAVAASARRALAFWGQNDALATIKQLDSLCSVWDLDAEYVHTERLLSHLVVLSGDVEQQVVSLRYLNTFFGIRLLRNTNDAAVRMLCVRREWLYRWWYALTETTDPIVWTALESCLKNIVWLMTALMSHDDHDSLLLTILESLYLFRYTNPTGYSRLPSHFLDLAYYFLESPAPPPIPWARLLEQDRHSTFDYVADDPLGALARRIQDPTRPFVDSLRAVTNMGLVIRLGGVSFTIPRALPLDFCEGIVKAFGRSQWPKEASSKNMILLASDPLTRDQVLAVLRVASIATERKVDMINKLESRFPQYSPIDYARLKPKRSYIAVLSCTCCVGSCRRFLNTDAALQICNQGGHSFSELIDTIGELRWVPASERHLWHHLIQWTDLSERQGDSEAHTYYIGCVRSEGLAMQEPIQLLTLDQHFRSVDASSASDIGDIDGGLHVLVATSVKPGTAWWCDAHLLDAISGENLPPRPYWNQQIKMSRSRGW